MSCGYNQPIGLLLVGDSFFSINDRLFQRIGHIVLIHSLLSFLALAY